MSGRGSLGWDVEDRLIGRRRQSGPGLRGAALRAFAAVALGVALARIVPLPLGVGVLLAGVAFVLARPTRGLSLYLALVGSGMAYAAVRAPAPPDPAVHESPGFRGVVVEESGRRLPGRLVVELDPPGSGRVIVWLKDTLVRPRYGDELVAAVPVRAFDYPRNPGLPDWNERMRNRGYVGRATVTSLQLQLTGNRRGAFLQRLAIAPARERLRELVAGMLPAREGAVLMALLAGDRRDIPDEATEVMRGSGLMHVLAVSGLHVGIVAGLAWLLLALLGIRGWWRFGVGAVVVALYVLFVGARASAVRAGAMSLAVALAWTGQRRVEPAATLGVAGLALLLADPNAFFDSGARLSFAAAAGIIAALTVIERPRFSGLPLPVVLQRPAASLLRMLIVSAAAFGATAPFLLSEFGQVNLLAIPASPAAVALTGLIIPLGALAALLTGSWPPLGAPLAETVRLLISGLVALAAVVARLGRGVVRVGTGGGLVPLVAAVVLLLLLHWRQRWARAAAAGVVLLAVVVAVWAAALRRPADRVWFLDPGRGDAMVFEDDAGRAMLYDAGIVGPGVVRDFLRRHGIDRLAVVVLTHPDIDHYGGLLDIAGSVPIERLVVPTAAGPPDYRALLERLRAGGTRVSFAAAGTELGFGGFQFRFVWPDEPARRLHAAGMLDPNDVSLVAVLERGGFRVLLTGDLDDPDLVAGRGITARWVKSAHHGSRAGNEPGFYAMADPELVVVMGRWPTPAGLEDRLPASGIGYINTRRDGGVSLEFRRDGAPAVRDHRGRLVAAGRQER
jgi:competence protein ComEC